MGIMAIPREVNPNTSNVVYVLNDERIHASSRQSNNPHKTSQARNAVVHTQIHLGKPRGMDGFGLEVEGVVEGVDQELVDAGHEVSSSWLSL